MSTEGVRFRHQIRQVRSAFAKAEYFPSDELTQKYQLSFSFLQQLRTVGLLSLIDSNYWKGEHWLNEPRMSVDKFLSIARSKPTNNKPHQLIKSSVDTRRDGLVAAKSKVIYKPIIRMRRSLSVKVKFKQGKELSGVLSWQSSYDKEFIESIRPENRTLYYEKEMLESDEKLYSITDLEQHLIGAIFDFFGKSLNFSVRYTHIK